MAKPQNNTPTVAQGFPSSGGKIKYGGQKGTLQTVSTKRENNAKKD